MIQGIRAGVNHEGHNGDTKERPKDCTEDADGGRKEDGGTQMSNPQIDFDLLGKS
jgi:hypothetical protein